MCCNIRCLLTSSVRVYLYSIYAIPDLNINGFEFYLGVSKLKVAFVLPYSIVNSKYLLIIHHTLFSY